MKKTINYIGTLIFLVLFGCNQDSQKVDILNKEIDSLRIILDDHTKTLEFLQEHNLIIERHLEMEQMRVDALVECLPECTESN